MKYLISFLLRWTLRLTGCRVAYAGFILDTDDLRVVVAGQDHEPR